MNVIIVISNYYCFEGKRVKIGGLQTYIRDLSELCSRMGHNVSIIQFDKANPDGVIGRQGNITIINKWPQGNNQQRAFDEIARQYPDALFILATDQLRIRVRGVKGLQIQHGIAFDIPGNMIKGFWGKTHWLQFVNKCLRCVKNVRRFYQAPHTVCVDYNYFNWFRTLGTIRPGQKMTVIPNYAGQILSEEELEKKLNAFNGVRKIVFARRFVDYRGTLMFANIIPEILRRYPDVTVTLAGDGPLEAELHKRFDANSSVKFAKFDSSRSLEFHKEFDLAIVPTIFSEGTSLSLCEAMAAGCLPICTHVGGMTNIVLDGFNGLMVYPDESELLGAIDAVMSYQPDKYKQMVRNAYNCTSTAFSRKHWERMWTKVIASYC